MPTDVAGFSEGVGSAKATNMRPQAIFAAVISALFVWGLIDGLQNSLLGGIYTIGIAVVMLPLALYMLYVTVTGKTDNIANYDQEEKSPHNVPLIHYILWLAGFIATIWAIGFWLAITAFFIIFLRVKSDASWLHVMTLSVCGVGFITALSWLMVLNFPPGLLQEYFDLPWPLR